jgi:DNA-binding NarL/FixJ family response regulator
MSTTGVRNGILIVEDDPLVGGYVSEILHKFAFQISGCASYGPEAIALAEMNAPALAIADIHLTGQMDGIEVARILRARFNVPTIFLSGVDDAATLDRARIACPLGFLKKPFLPSQLIGAISQSLIFDTSNRSFDSKDGSTAAAEGG